jgi:Bacterial PH domain
MSRTMLLPVVLFALGLLPVALLGPWAPVVLVLPLLVALWVLRVGVTVSDIGITVHALLGDRSLPWDDVAGIRVGARRGLFLVTRRGTELRLPVVRARDLPRLSSLSGGRLADPSAEGAPVPPPADR